MRIIAFITLLFLSVSAFAEEAKKPVFEYRPSELGIDYKTLAPYPLGAILSQGEGEFLENARSDFEGDTEDVWLELVEHVAKVEVSNMMVCALEDFTPHMLRHIAIAIEPNDEQYALLQSYASSFVINSAARTLGDEKTNSRC